MQSEPLKTQPPEHGPAALPTLPPRYYLDNFQRLREAVEARYGDLLSSGERAVLAAFDALPPYHLSTSQHCPAEYRSPATADECRDAGA